MSNNHPPRIISYTVSQGKPESIPKASRETRRLLRWRQRARFRQHVRDAAMAILIVAGACLALALVSGLDLLFQVAPIAAP